MALMQNKKGMMFTILTITLLSLFLLSYGMNSYVKDRSSINKRINTMNSFVFSIEQDLPRKLYLSGFRIIFLIEKEISETGDYISDFDSLFQEAFYNGTLDGVDYASEGGIMYGVTYSGILNSLNEKAESVNVNISLENPEINVSQEDPWNVKVSLTGDLLIMDKGNLALWEKTSIITAYVPVENFEDPLYLVETNGLVTNKINKTIYSVPVIIGNLPDHVEKGYYVNSALAPSFLDRLEGVKTANVDGNGIESLVYLPGLSQQGISVRDKSVVDYIYFSNENPSASNIAGMPSWFKLDDAHLGTYGV